MGSRVQKQAKPKIRGYPLQHTLPPRQRGFEGFHVGTSKGPGKCMDEGSGKELIVLKGLPLPLPQVGARQQTPIPTF